jgi:hypothetical protein
MADGSCFGLADAAMGEFRAPSADILRRRIEATLQLALEQRKIDARTTVCITPSHPLKEHRDDIAM